MTHPLRIAFIHPDLGIGGAERLVVDAALGLTQLGHTVTIYTSFHTTARSFAETHDGTLQVRVLGGWLVPRSVFQRCVTICAVLRQLHLSLHLIYLSLSLFLSHQSVCDVFFVDQLSAAIPLLRYLTRTPVLFYGHFPDLLLSSDNNPSSGLLAKLKALYRLPLDWLEEYTTGWFIISFFPVFPASVDDSTGPFQPMQTLSSLIPTSPPRSSPAL
jgi:alpha-1,3/alpha-1,6-mannosyltransferase